MSVTTLQQRQQVVWPPKLDLYGIQVSPTDYAETTRLVIEAARARLPSVVSCHAVHALVSSSCDPYLRERVNRFDVVTPDGQPVRWALNALYGAGLTDRVYGPQLTMHICQAAAQAGVSVYLYGGSQDAVTRMSVNLCQAVPGLEVAGFMSPPFRPLTPEEDAEVVREINDSGARIVFVGLGFPKQDWFASEHQGRIRAVQVCVGAAFDFHAGTKKVAPAWLQRNGLEWLFRLGQEPRRLWKRYLVTNSLFIGKFLWALPKIMKTRRDYATLTRADLGAGNEGCE